jgi:hypothetical protein
MLLRWLERVKSTPDKALNDRGCTPMHLLREEFKSPSDTTSPLVRVHIVGALKAFC